MRSLNILVGLSLLTAVSGSGADVSLSDYGPKADGLTLDTQAIQRAIDASAAAGGGTVQIPPGRYASGTFWLKSHVTLALDAGAVIVASPRMEDYPVKHLIVADGAEDIAIVGQGTIDGNGDAFFDAEHRPKPRPSPLLEFDRCRGVRIEDVTIRRAPAWTVHPQDCDDVRIRGISLLNDLRAINTDGLDIDSSRNVAISDCHIEAGDDCIVLKTSGRDHGSQAAVGPTENVVVTNCVLVSAATALKLGTESRADFRHCVFSNCVIRDSRTGIGLFALDGGTMEDIRFSNIEMTTKPKWGQGLEWPIEVKLDRRDEDSKLSRIRDIAFDGISLETKGRILVSGLPDSPIENVSFHDVTMRVTGFEALGGARSPRGGAKTGQAQKADPGAMPAAMIFSQVRGLTIDGVRMFWPPSPAGTDRDGIFGDGIEDYRMNGVAVPGLGRGQALHLEHSRAVVDSRLAGWRQAILDNFFVPTPLPALDAEIHRTFSPAPGVNAQGVTYTTALGMRVPAILYLPDPLPRGKIPGFVVVCGHGGDKYDWYSYYTGVLYARAGAAVLTYDVIGEGEREAGRKSGTREHDKIQGGENLARHLAGLMITDVMQGVAYLASRPEVDAARIGAGGYSMGSFVLALAGAVDPQLHAAVLCGGGNLDGPGGYWDHSGKPMCQALPYQSLQFLGDRPAIIYALHAARGPTLVWNGREDSVVNMPRTQDDFFLDLRRRVIELRGGEDDAFEFGFTPQRPSPSGPGLRTPAGHRPYWVTKPVAIWLNDQLHFPNWNDAQIAAMPEVKIGDWAKANGAELEKMYGTDEREGGAMALDVHAPRVPREALNVFTAEEWPRVRDRYVIGAWLRAAQADDRAKSPPPSTARAGK